MLAAFYVEHNDGSTRGLGELDLPAVPRVDETVHLPDAGSFVVWKVIWRLDREKGLRYAVVTVVTIARYRQLYADGGWMGWLVREDAGGH